MQNKSDCQQESYYDGKKPRQLIAALPKVQHEFQLQYLFIDIRIPNRWKGELKKTPENPSNEQAEHN